MIKLLGQVMTKRPTFNDEGEQLTEPEYSTEYYGMSSRQVVGLTPTEPDGFPPAFSGVQTYYYAFTDETEAKQALDYDEETESFDVDYAPTVAQFKASRQQALDNAIVTTESGKQFDADEQSIIRLANALIAAQDEADDFTIQWSLANDGTGVMTDCTKAEIREAHKLAMSNMQSIWGV